MFTLVPPAKAIKITTSLLKKIANSSVPSAPMKIQNMPESVSSADLTCKVWQVK